MNKFSIEEMPFVHRDLSWLSFNYRVLQEAKDPNVPLLERIKFLGIYSSNLEEFFRVRVAALRRLLLVGNKTKKRMDFAPEVTLDEIRSVVKKQQMEFSELFQKEILPALQNEGIHIVRLHELDFGHFEELTNYVEETLVQHIQPILMVKGKIRTFLRNSALYLAVVLETSGGTNRYALVRVPTDTLPRFVELSSEHKDKKNIILLDDLVRHALPSLFPGYTVTGSFSIKLSRDAELHIEDEFSGDLISKIKKSLAKRNVGKSTRFVYDRKMPENLVEFLMENFDLNKQDMNPEGRYHNNFDFFKFPSFGKNHLKEVPLPPLNHPVLEGQLNFFPIIAKQDRLLHFPYQKYDYVLQFLEQAAHDPAVLSIKVTQYRVAKDSQIVLALKRALQAGKEVVVFVEVKARFDEEANLSWAEKLESWGAKVLYSLPEIKVHAKLAMITRLEAGEPRKYCYLSTGNFNENTALIYGDFGFFTADPRITEEVGQIFDFLQTNGSSQLKPKHLLVGQDRLRKEIWKRIDAEIAAAKSGKPAEILLKMNSLQDQRMIHRLYQASMAGVKVKIIVRGICCLVPQLPIYSENIEVISIVDRFLEHTRIYIFHNEGRPEMFLSSADWMTRNLYHRIECAFPIYDESLQQEIFQVLKMQWQDNVKARIISPTANNTYKPRAANEPPIRSQIETYNFYKKGSMYNS